MGLVEVDVIRLQAAERVFDGAHNMTAAQAFAVGAVPHFAAHFGGEDDFAPVAFALHPFADGLK